jgi:iron complex outermembrane receptor protein
MLLAALAPWPTFAATDSLKRMSIEELMDVEIYSASRRLEPSQAAPDAIYVLTGNEIRRSGATSIPEALRLVPGVQVGRVDANKWAVSIRGFNSREANKLLVLMDGRSIYDPLFSGVLWEAQDAMLEDIDRIEVVRGPGGTLWGANAFNGVINIITKRASETQGALLSASAGDEDKYTAAARFGWQTGEDQFARVYFKALERDTGYSAIGPPHDGTTLARGGFRWDWNAAQTNDFHVSGDVFSVDADSRETPALVQTVKHRGHNVMARWNHAFSETNSVRMRIYYDDVTYDGLAFDQDRSTYDLELQQTLQAGPAHLVVWGGGYRRMRDNTHSLLAGFVDVLPKRRDDALSNVFAQDTLTLMPDRLHLTVGLKYEKTDYAESEWLPNIRLAWTPSPEQTWWAGVSDAVRVPSRLESDLTFLGTLRPGNQFEAEHVRAYGIGHRQLVSSQFWYDVTLFYQDYDDLRASQQNGFLRNFMDGDTYGVEVALRWQPTMDWRLEAAYSYLTMDLSLTSRATGNPGQPTYVEGLAPRNQFSLRAGVDVADNLELDATMRYVDELTSLRFDNYAELDLGATWYPLPFLELSLVGQNLLHDHHPEQAFAFSGSGMYTEVERRAYGKATWRF